MHKRNFLFLQGPTSPFFSRLGDKLIQRGAKVFRVNFNMGDYFYWRNKPAWQFRQPASALPAWLEEKLRENNITDIIMVGDTRPVNAPAVPLAKKHNIRLHVFEEGYLRPNFLTLEEDGINGYSPLPKNPDWYRHVGEQLPEIQPTKAVRNPVRLLAMHEIGYHLPGLLNKIFYNGYKTHRPFISGIELFGWARRLGYMPVHEARDARTIKQLIDSQQPYFMLPLQLDSDSQIQVHSKFENIAQVIHFTMRSFARYAPENSLLIIKNHPLDTGFCKFKQRIEKWEKQLGIENRTLYLESGHLPTLLDHCSGTIVVNSTVGTSALIHKCRTITLSSPVYDIQGLTAQCRLDEFWTDETQPDMQLLEYFRRVVIHTTQINGGFYSDEGIKTGIESSVERLLMTESPLQQLYNLYPLQTQQLTTLAHTPEQPATPRQSGLAALIPDAELTETETLIT